MTTDTREPIQKRNVRAAVLAAVLLLTAVGGFAFYLLVREDPRDASAPPVPVGDRIERRMDAFIDGVRPRWADHVETRLKRFLARVGWN